MVHTMMLLSWNGVRVQSALIKSIESTRVLHTIAVNCQRHCCSVLEIAAVHVSVCCYFLALLHGFYSMIQPEVARTSMANMQLYQSISYIRRKKTLLFFPTILSHGLLLLLYRRELSLPFHQQPPNNNILINAIQQCRRRKKPIHSLCSSIFSFNFRIFVFIASHSVRTHIFI